MRKIDTTVVVQTYKDDYADVEGEPLTIKSHWNIGRYIVLVIDGKKITIDGYELKEAVTKCMNV